MTRSTLALAALSTLALGACLLPKSNTPHSGAVPTGEQLAVVDDVKVWTTTHKEKVAETEYRDSGGNVVGTGAVYADKTDVHAMKIWYPVQGTQQLTDADFFRIAGDQASLDATSKMRASGRKWHRRGLFAIGGGAVAMIASYFVHNTKGRLVLDLGGLVAVTGGYYVSWWGAQRMNPGAHAVDRSVADQAARHYNQGLGHTVGLSLTRTF
jgi:hypothetical protein